MVILSIISKLLDAMLALAGQLTYFEAKQTTEALYEADKKKIDSVIASHILGDNDVLLDGLLPPGGSSDSGNSGKSE